MAAEKDRRSEQIDGLKAQLDAVQATDETASYDSPHEFPKWMYHEKHGARLVEDESGAEALGGGWSETP